MITLGPLPEQTHGMAEQNRATARTDLSASFYWLKMRTDTPKGLFCHGKGGGGRGGEGSKFNRLKRFSVSIGFALCLHHFAWVEGGGS